MALKSLSLGKYSGVPLIKSIKFGSKDFSESMKKLCFVYCQRNYSIWHIICLRNQTEQPQHPHADRHMQYTQIQGGLRLPPFALSLGHQLFDFSPLQRCKRYLQLCNTKSPQCKWRVFSEFNNNESTVIPVFGWLLITHFQPIYDWKQWQMVQQKLQLQKKWKACHVYTAVPLFSPPFCIQKPSLWVLFSHSSKETCFQHINMEDLKYRWNEF